MYYELLTRLPGTFDFESCGVLFYERASKALYRLESGPDIRTIPITAENIVRYPTNIGLTGVVLKAGKSMIFEEGERD